MSAVPSYPRLCLISQSGVEDTVFDEHGAPRVIKTVAKKGVLVMRIGQLRDPVTPPMDFTKYGVCCTLVLDQNRQMTVESLSSPLEFKLQTSQGGAELRVEARVNVLSSQYERSFFCIHVQLKDEFGNPVPGASVYSQPFRVRSKVKSSESVANTPNVHSPRKRNLPGLPPLSSAKRARQDVSVQQQQPANDSFMMQVMQALERIENRQIQAEQTLAERTPTEHTSVSSYGSPSSLCESHVSPTTTTYAQQFQVPTGTFSQQFLQLMSIFSGFSDLEKQSQVETIRNTATAKEQNAVSMLTGLLNFVEPNVKSDPSDQFYDEVAGLGYGSI